MTAALVIGLTLYAVTTKHDFTLFGGLLWALSTLLITLGLISLFFGSTMRLIYCTVGLIIYSVFLVFDT